MPLISRVRRYIQNAREFKWTLRVPLISLVCAVCFATRIPFFANNFLMLNCLWSDSGSYFSLCLEGDLGFWSMWGRAFWQAFYFFWRRPTAPVVSNSLQFLWRRYTHGCRQKSQFRLVHPCVLNRHTHTRAPTHIKFFIFLDWSIGQSRKLMFLYFMVFMNMLLSTLVGLVSTLQGWSTFMHVCVYVWCTVCNACM